MPKKITRTSDLVPDSRNANKGTERGSSVLENSLRKYGAGRSILIDKNGNILAGNKTVEKAVELGMENLVVVQTNGDKIVAVQRMDLDINGGKHARELAIADNRTSELSLEWDDVMLKGLGEEISLDGFFSDDELNRMFGNAPIVEDEGEFKAEKLQKKWKVKTGQVWLIGNHRILCGDSTRAEDVERIMAKDSADLMVTDPPYGVKYDPKWRDGIGGKFTTKANAGKRIANDSTVKWNEAWALFPGSVAYVWHPSLYTAATQTSLLETGFEIRNQIVWAKQHFALSRGHYNWQHEPCWYAVKSGAKANWIGDRKQSTIWEISSLNPAGRKEERFSHGTQKPIECMARPIRNHKSEWVYDPFAGSGPTLAACEQLNRKCIAIDIEPECVAVTLERMSRMNLEIRLDK